LDDHLESDLKNRKNHSDVLWRIINIELWLRTFMDSDAIDASRRKCFASHPGPQKDS
jgi:hypothetical protein